MTTIQLNALNAQMWRDLGTIAEDEGMMRRVAKYLRKVVKEMNADPTLMTREDFLARIEDARKQKGKSFANVDELDKYIRSL